MYWFTIFGSSSSCLLNIRFIPQPNAPQGEMQVGDVADDGLGDEQSGGVRMVMQNAAVRREDSGNDAIFR